MKLFAVIVYCVIHACDGFVFTGRHKAVAHWQPPLYSAGDGSDAPDSAMVDVIIDSGVDTAAPVDVADVGDLSDNTHVQDNIGGHRTMLPPPLSPLNTTLATRRDWLTQFAGVTVLSGVVLMGAVQQPDTFSTTTSRSKPKTLAPVNITKVAQETNINITMDCTTTCVSLDSKTFQKKQTLKLPGWVPSYLVPPPKVIRDVTTSELLVAAIVAGSAVEATRTAVLYPLQTLKTRIQTDVNRRKKSQSLRWQLRVLKLKALKHFREGNLYAGLLPSLLISVPTTGVYYGGRDITKQMIGMAHLNLPDIYVAVLAAFVGDVVSLVFRTPADTLAIRLQAATGDLESEESQEDQEEIVEEKVGNYLSESLVRLPAVIATDLPYLLSRIALNSIILPGPIDMGHYEIGVFSTAVLCAFMTTPFDVARTRILVNGEYEKYRGLFPTFRDIVKEGEGGLSNLWAGWLERTTYLGISALWLPFSLVFYIAVRDTILLEWFD